MTNYLRKRGWPVDTIELFISDLTECPNQKVAFAASLYSIALDVLGWIEKYRDKKDKYILNSIKGYGKNQKVMIFMEGRTYERRVGKWKVVCTSRPY